VHGLDLGAGKSLNIKRAAKVLKALALNPGHLVPYMRDSVFNPESYDVWSQAILNQPIKQRRIVPVQNRAPWFSFSAIQFLKQYLNKNMHLFEWGSGGSTLFFAQRCASVKSVENDPSWMQFLENELATNSITNVVIAHCVWSEWRAEEFLHSSYLNAIGKDTYDVIVIDGFESSDFALRPLCFARAQKQIKSGGIIVVDDAWRYKELRKDNCAKAVRTFESVGPSRLGVTSTDFYFY
jgi:hypothetical protein